MKSYIYYFLTLVLLAGVTGCGEKSSTNETSVETEISSFIEVTQAQYDQLGMEMGSIIEKSFPVRVSVNGMIDVPPENRAMVNATMGGYIKTTPFLIGDKVSKGQTLVTLENPEFVSLQQQYLEVNEQLSFLKAEYERHTIMSEENITSQKNFLKSESDYKSALARHSGLQKQLQMLNISPEQVKNGTIVSTVSIKAPISGSITKVNVTKGSYVSPATAIMEIINNDHVHLELSVFEKDIMKVKKGQKITFRIPEASGDTFHAKVYLVGTSIDANRTIKVHGHLEDEGKEKFLTGMFVEANIITDDIQEKALPSNAIVTIDNIPNVLIFEKKEGDVYYFSQKEVSVDEELDGFSVIKEANSFAPNTQFLTKGTYNLIGE
ncbi:MULTISPECIES: efflux RND transporter periplasmic adaptor subunit [Maribacter]|uniref:Efflux RND transporter periplasmic adaptor subunit n=1 Tax=Maribacter flavus TaxID=1658664 RepID=A0ABU7IIW6_9FLAO|nr:MULTISPECIES: efflux RND transporter periplasmic adaptor subunit [Maribacter]MDC6405844.1 efflux RND transporter periplasmic adaptor subunit [Maribacter sp. PR66]MEE1972904.1 efflux RND transporter periplasmic adaptor subunit [Maribacter flavus]